MTRNTLHDIHVWLSLPLGILITLICLSGATLVFKNEIRNALGMPRVEAHHNVKKAVAKPLAEQSRVHKHKHKAADAPHGTTRKRDFFSYVTRFHTSFYLGVAGRWIVTYTTVAFVIVLVSGVWMVWPRSRKQWRQRFAVVVNKTRHKLFYDLHVSLGFWTLVWILAIAITGAAIGLHLVPKGTAWMTAFHEIHVGKWGGIATKVITFTASIIGASLPITGYWLYFKKRAMKRKTQK